MFDRASKIRIPTTVAFYLLTILLSMVLLSVLRVSTRNFYFGIATTLLAHAAVYLLTRERIPAWATLFVLALVVPQFPPEALTPVEQGALYWGILVGLVSYTLTYGAHYLLRRNQDEPGKGAPEGRRRNGNRHTSELFQLLNVTNLSQAVRATRRLLQERERLQSDSVPPADTTQPSEGDVPKKLKEAQQQIKELRKKLEDAKQPRESERRQMLDRLEETQRQMEEIISARDLAEERAQSLEGFQLKVADLTQQLNAARGQSQEHEQLVSQVREAASQAQRERDAARAENERIQSELAQRDAEIRQASLSLAEATSARESLEQAVEGLRQQAESTEMQNRELLAQLQNTEQTLAQTHGEYQGVQDRLERASSQTKIQPSPCGDLQARVSSLEMEKDRAVAELACLRSRLKEKSREIDRAQVRISELGPLLEAHEQQLAQAQDKIASLEDALSFYRRSIEELTPEVDRLDGIISQYESTYGPLPSA